MKSAYLLLVAGFATIGLLADGCVSGDTVNGGGGQTGSSSGGKTGGGNSSGSLGGSSFGSQGGFTGGSQGGFTGGSQGGFTGGSQGGFTGGGQGGLTGGGQGGTTTVAGPCTVAATDALIDDFEKALNGVAHPCVHGYWYTYNDGSAGTQTPAVNMWMNVAITDRTGSTMAGHSTGTGFTGDGKGNIFAGFGLDFNPSPTPTGMPKYTVNASAFKGISFFAKGSGTINVQLPTPKSDPALGCVNTTTTMCYDVATKIIPLPAAWTQFNLMWADFAVNGFGKTNEVIDGTGLGGIKFVSQLPSPATTFVPYDMWIDDLKFIP